MLYNIVLVSAIHQRESAIDIHTAQLSLASVVTTHIPAQRFRASAGGGRPPWSWRVGACALGSPAFLSGGGGGGEPWAAVGGAASLRRAELVLPPQWRETPTDLNLLGPLLKG